MKGPQGLAANNKRELFVLVLVRIGEICRIIV